jgi:hypothetical protein
MSCFENLPHLSNSESDFASNSDRINLDRQIGIDGVDMFGPTKQEAKSFSLYYYMLHPVKNVKSKLEISSYVCLNLDNRTLQIVPCVICR